MLSFGVTVLPDPPYQRLLELVVLAESHGFEYAWTYDSHVLWQESFPLLALAADRTSKIKLGHFVTNPGTREPTVVASSYATLHDLSDVLPLAQAVKITRSVAYFHDSGIAQATLVLGLWAAAAAVSKREPTRR